MPDTSERTGGPVTVRAPAKVNLHLGVGAPREDGFHPLETVYHAIGICDDVTVEAASTWSLAVSVPSWMDPATIPVDGDNIVDRAGALLAAHHGRPCLAAVEVVKAIPASRGYGNLLATVPGISGTGLDVSSNVSTNFFTSRGGRGNEGTIQIDGMNVGSAFNGGGVAGFGYDLANAQEIQITVSGGLGEADRGGPAFNMIPRTGGNSFSGTAFFSNAGEWSQGSNIDDELRGALGDEGFAELRGGLLEALDALGLGDDVRRRTVRPPGPELR